MSLMRFGSNPIIQVILSTVFVFCALEAVARLAYSLHSDYAEMHSEGNQPISWFRYSPVKGWENRPGYTGPTDDGIQRKFDENGVSFPDTSKPAGQVSKTVVFIGDSNTFGYGVPTSASFPEVTARIVPNVRAVNLSVVGYTSRQGRETLERYLATNHPSAVVASFNFNDRRGVLPGDEDGPAHFRNIYQASRSRVGRLDADLRFLFVYKDLRGVMQRLGMLKERDPRHAAVDSLHARVDEQQYRENLAAIANDTKRLGIPLVFVLLRDNPLQSAYLDRGAREMAHGDYDAAIEDFHVLIVENSMYSDLGRIFSAQAYRATGRGDEARRVLSGGERIVYLLGGRPIHPDWDYNAIMREVADRYKADLIDAASVLEKDPYVYIDFCHFNSVGHRKVAELLSAYLAKRLNDGAVLHDRETAATTR
jgi:lysophospholipase L1-like esterase